MENRASLLRIARWIRMAGAFWSVGFLLGGIVAVINEYLRDELEAGDGWRLAMGAFVGIAGLGMALALAWVITGLARRRQ